MVRIVIGFLLLLPLSGKVWGAEANLIRNGDFSPALESWTASDGGGDCAIRIDPQEKCGDRAAVLLRREKPESKAEGYLESKPFGVLPSHIYLLEVMVKGKDIPRTSPSPVLTARFLSSAQPNARMDWVKTGEYACGVRPSSGPGPGGTIPYGTFDWQPYRFYLRAYNGSDLATVRFSAPPSGTLWISNVQFAALPLVRGVKYEIPDVIPVDDAYGTAPEGYLTDGYFAEAQGMVDNKISRAFQNPSGIVTARLLLPKMTSVDRLVLVFKRPNMDWKLNRIEVYCNKYGRFLKASEGPGYLTQEFDQRVWLIEAPVRQKTDSIVVRFVGDGIIVPSQFMVVEGKGGREEVNRYLAAGWLVLAAATASPAAQPPVVVENEYVRMEFAPAEGGVCKRLLYKPTNKEMVYAYSDAGYGLFRDRFWSPSDYDFCDVVYQHEVTKTPNSTAIHLWGCGAGGVYGFTEIHKTITLTNGSPLVRAEYEIKNTVASMTDADYGFWVHNFLGVMGGKNEYFIPTTKGIMEVWHDPNQPAEDVWVNNPARGWMAGVGEGRNGIAWSAEYKCLNLFYQWRNGALPTCEWQYNRIVVPCGQSFKTTITLMPFKGLERVDGYFQGVAGSIALPAAVAAGDKAAPEIGLVAAGDRKLTLKFRSKLLPATGWTEIASKDVALKNMAVRTVPWPQEMTISAGTTVVACELLEDGRTIGEMERPLVAGTPSGQYALAPECAQVGSKEPLSVAAGPTVPEHKLSLEVATPHIPWAKPYAKGPLKALILTDVHCQREIVELMERFDLQVETEKIYYVPSETFRYTGFGDISVRTTQEAQARLNKKLEQPLDVIMIAGLPWSKDFSDENRKLILDKVKAGTGLVYVGPIGIAGELKEALPFLTGEKKAGYGFMAPRQKNFLTAGIPYDLLPQIGALAYAGQVPGANAVLEQGSGAAKKDIPLLTTGQIGKGRCACFLWEVQEDDLKADQVWGVCRITPRVVNEQGNPAEPGPVADRAGRTITWRCCEYFFALAGKGLLWAANCEPDLSAAVTGRDAKGDVTGAVECPDEHRSAILEMTYRNRFSEDEKTDQQKVDLVNGSNPFRFTPPPDLMPGITLTDLRVLTPDGKVITWASNYYETKPLLAISSVEFEKTILPPGAAPMVRGRVKFTGDPAPENGLEIRVTDFNGRLVCRQFWSGLKTPMEFEARLLDAATIPMTVELRLTRGAQILDQRTQTLLFLKERVWNPLRCNQCEWYDSVTRVRLPYLTDFERKLIPQMGVATVMDGPVNARFAAGVNAYASPTCFWNFGEEKFSVKNSAYAKSKDRKFLVRDPCLWDPVYREKTREAMHKAAHLAMTYGGGYIYCLTDETTLTEYNRYFDFDFAPASIAAYRDWLKKRYGTVAALNKEWSANYKDWGEIEPMTLEEAQKREDGNYAPWADFRTFMDDTVEDFISFTQKCLEEVDPLAKVSMSGTMDAAAGNGLDWWKLCHSFKALNSYLVNDTQYMQEAFARTTGVLNAPYLESSWSRSCGPIAEAKNWWGVFYECFGRSSDGMPNYFFPDLTLTEAGQTTKDHLAEVNAGLWPLVRNARRDPATIALLYSQPSIQGNTVLNGGERVAKIRDAWIALLHDSGLQFDFVAYAQLAESPGFLAKQGYKVLILPEAVALSDKEAAEITAFAQIGGVVIADNCVGWMNEHCRTLKTGQLDSLFGLAADRQPLAGKPKLTMKEDWAGLKRGEGLTDFAPVGKVAAAKATSVVACDDPASEAVFRCQVGKGWGVYLNVSVLSYVEDRDSGARGEQVFRQLIGGALSLANVQPEFAVEATGKKAFHGHVVSFTDGKARYLGVIREFARGEPDESFAIHLPDSFHVYDVRAQKYLGKTGRINVVLYAGAAKLYALVPHEMSAPVLSCPGAAALGSKLAGKIGVAEPRDAHQVVRLEVYDPSGALRPCYSWPQILPPGKTEAPVEFTLALNDPAGNWTVRAVELLSGKTAERKIAVKE